MGLPHKKIHKCSICGNMLGYPGGVYFCLKQQADIPRDQVQELRYCHNFEEVQDAT